MATPSNSYLDAKGRPIVAVTGMGLVTALGRGKAANWKAVTAGRSGIMPLTASFGDRLPVTASAP